MSPFRVIAFATFVLAASPLPAAAQAPPERPAPKILIDQPARAVEYQLNRLPPVDLVRLERKPDDPRYRLVYLALLSRKSIDSAIRDEALKVLVAMDRRSAGRVLLEALSKVAADDTATGDKLLSLVVSQPAADLARERAVFEGEAQQAQTSWTVRGALAALYAIDGEPITGIRLAVAARRQPDSYYALRTLPAGSSGGAARQRAFSYLSGFVSADGAAPGDAARIAAFDALGWTMRDAATFGILARAITADPDPAVKAAAIRSLNRLSPSAVPVAEAEPLARTIMAMVDNLPPSRRTEPDGVEALQAGEMLASVLPDATRRAVRRDLRALGVRVITLETIVEQMSYDKWWFVVEAGKPMQIVFTNREAMPHNVVIGRPGTLQDIGNAAGVMALPTEPAAKPYVPSLPSVLRATGLLKEGETERLGFTAPPAPGEYVFLCSFPGHWVRMYGVMLVVPDLDAWEAAPTVPTDPMTKQPFASQVRTGN